MTEPTDPPPDVFAALERCARLAEDLRGFKRRPERLSAWLTAATLLSSDAEDQALVQRTDGIRTRLAAERGAPSGSLRWIYAGVFASRDIPVERFLQTRQALRDERRASKAATMHAGGARAALVLCAGGEIYPETIRRFFSMKQALQPPWWRRSASVTDTVAAAHVLKEDAEREVIAKRDRSRSVFEADKALRRHKHDGARLCALYDADPIEMRKRFMRLEGARRSSRALRRTVTKGALIDWAAQGFEPDHLQTLERLMAELPRLDAMAGAKAQLAHLIAIGGGSATSGIAAMSAVIAARAAMIATTIAATSTVTTTTATS
ncbi:MAG: hypothetical protein AAFX09_03985 [Pseudomonadota bacterium]